MTISVGTRLPGAELIRKGEAGFEAVDLAAFLKGRKVVLFALPGAFTTDCAVVHLPSFIETAKAFRDKGFDEIACISVNDPFVMAAWGETSGATEAGIAMLADADAAFTKAVGMAFSAPPVGLYDRSGRYAVAVDDGVITHAMIDEPGACDVTRGRALLEALG